MRRFIIIEPAIEGWTGHYYEYAVRVLRSAKNANFEPILAVNKNFSLKTPQDIHHVPIFECGQGLVPENSLIGKIKNKIREKLSHKSQSVAIKNTNVIETENAVRWLLRNTLGRYKSKIFYKNIQQLFKQISLEADDIIFFPTASEYELAGLLNFFNVNKQYNPENWHFLFHSNIIPQALNKMFTRIKSLSKGFNFYTDTEQLTALYNQLNVLPFKTLPIPIQLESAVFNFTQKTTPPYVVSYMGDARREKGYHHLPQIISNLWDDHVVTNKVRFILQSNFNREGGERAAVNAREQLESYPVAYVTLLKEPLEPMDYAKLLSESDIVLFPYDRYAYEKRSSGIFTEALVAGIPIIVPEGSWMAAQLVQVVRDYKEDKTEIPTNELIPLSVIGMIYKSENDIPVCIKEIISHYNHYKETAMQFSKSWKAYHNPMSLLSNLGVV